MRELRGRCNEKIVFGCKQRLQICVRPFQNTEALCSGGRSQHDSVPRARHFLNTGFCRGWGRKGALVVNQEESCSNQRYFFLKKFIQICRDIKNTCRVKKFE